MLELALVLLGVCLTVLVVGGVVIYKHLDTFNAIKADVEDRLTKHDAALSKSVEVINKNAEVFLTEIAALKDRVGKIQTVGFLTKRVQDGSGSN